MSDDDALLISCGRCGRQVRVPYTELRLLRTFDCQWCRVAERIKYPRASDAAKAVGVEPEAEIDVRLAEISRLMGSDELSMIVRKAVGFSDRELKALYGTSAIDIGQLLERLVDCVR